MAARQKRWQARPCDERQAQALTQGRGLPEIVGRVLAARGVTDETCDTFLNPTLKALLPDPSRFRDMDPAAERIARAIRDGEPVAVFGDYDVDGATSAALLRRFFRSLGADIRVYVPDRLKEEEPNCEVLSCKVVPQGKGEALETVVRTRRGPFSMTVIERRLTGTRFDYEVKYTVETQRFDALAPKLRQSLDSFRELPGVVPGASGKSA